MLNTDMHNKQAVRLLSLIAADVALLVHSIFASFDEGGDGLNLLSCACPLPIDNYVTF